MSTLHNGKSKIEKNREGYKIVIPSKKNWFTLLFSTFWMGGWAMGFTFASTTLFSGGWGDGGRGGIDLFLLFWLLAWTVGGIMVSFTILWGYFGKEIIFFKGNQVLFCRHIFGIGTTKEMERNSVGNFRFNQIDNSWGIFSRRNSWDQYGLGDGKIKMDYGMKTYSFGLSLDDAEANYLIEEMKKQMVV